MTTVECGEGKHDLCVGYGKPRELLTDDLPDRPLDCECICHLDGRGIPLYEATP